MADRDLTIGIKTTADTSGAKAADAALDGVTTSARQANTAAQALTTHSASMGAGMGKMGMLANQASFQIGDFTQQVTMGTHWTRAFAQQAPQLIGAFQMAGLATGPLAIGLGAVAVALPLVASGISALTGATDDATKKLDEAATYAGKLAEAEIAATRKAAEAAVKEAEAAIINWDALKAAQAEAAKAVMAGESKMLEAREKLNAAMGRTIDLTKEKEALDKSHREQNAKLEAEAAVREGWKSTEAANQAIQEANRLQKDRDAKQAEAMEINSQVQAMRDELAQLRQQRAAVPSPAAAILRRIGGERGGPDPRALADQRTDLDIRIQTLESIMSDSLGRAGALAADALKLDEPLAKAQNAATEAQNAAIVNAAAVDTAVKKIQDTMERDNTVAEIDALDASMRQRAADLDNVLATMTPLTTGMETAMQNLRTLSEDGVLATDETKQLAVDSGRLIAGLQAGTVTSTENMRTLIGIMEKFSTEQKTDAARILSLQTSSNDSREQTNRAIEAQSARMSKLEQDTQNLLIRLRRQ